MHPAGDIAGVGVVTSTGSARIQPWSRHDISFPLGPGNSGAMSPRVRGPQRMVSASATLGGGCVDRLGDPFGDPRVFSPAPPAGQASRPLGSARVAAPTTGGSSVSATSGPSTTAGSSSHGAHSPPARSSFGVRATNSIGANRRNKSVERGLSPGVPATRTAPQGSVTLATADGLSHSYAVVAESVEAEDAYLNARIQPHPSSASRPHLWVPTSATPPAASSVYIPRSCWTHLDTYRAAAPSGYLQTGVPQAPSGYMNRPTGLEAAQPSTLHPSTLQGLGSARNTGIAVQGLSGPGLTGGGLRSQVAPPSSQWPRQGYAQDYGPCSPRMGLGISGALTPAQPPPSFASASTPATGSSIAAAMMRSASDLPGGARFPVAGAASPGTPQVAVTPGSTAAEPRDLRIPRDCRNLDDSNISGSTTCDSVSRQSSKITPPQVVSMSLVPEVEQEFLRRIVALEQKVVDRDGLLAKLTHQQVRLDRLETLARENEILKAQMRDDLRRRPVSERGSSKDARRAAGGKSSMAGGQNRSDNNRGDSNRNDNGREALLPREMLSARRVVSPPIAEVEKGVEPLSPQANGSRSALSVGVSHQVNRCSSSGLVSPAPQTDRVDRPPPRRMMSAPMDYVPPQYETAKVVTASDLESRLEELEQALGLQPGVNGKCNGVMRERSI